MAAWEAPRVTLLHADRALAARIEDLAAQDGIRMARAARRLFPDREPAWIEVAGGSAAYVWRDSPFNGAIGMGLQAEVTAQDIVAIEEFFAQRDLGATVNTCPLADPSLFALLAERGYVPLDVENVLVVDLSDGLPAEHEQGVEPAASVEVRICSEAERDVWARVAAQGFADNGVPSQAELDISTMVAHRPDAVLLLATVHGEIAGTGEILTVGDVGFLSGDATLARYRGIGVQTALQRERLRIAVEAGCDIAITEATPGSGSQRNQERRGFQVAYTRFEVHRPLDADPR